MKSYYLQDLEGTMLREISQSEKDKHHIISLIVESEDQNKTETDSDPEVD